MEIATMQTAPFCVLFLANMIRVKEKFCHFPFCRDRGMWGGAVGAWCLSLGRGGGANPSCHAPRPCSHPLSLTLFGGGAQRLLGRRDRGMWGGAVGASC